MRKLFKKSLACVLAVALCLTAMVGVLTVSADTLDGTIEIADVTIEAGSTTATIPVTFTVTGDEADLINTGYINYEIDGATVTRVYDSVGNLGTNTAGSMFEIWLDETGEGGAKVANANIVVEFTAETESFTLKLSNNTSATNTEKLIYFGTAEKTFTVKAAHVHNFVPTVTKDATCEEDGVKTFACECGKDTYTEAIPAIGHKWDEGVVTTAPDCDDAGVKTYTCANDASHTKTEAINALGHTPGEAAEENRVEAKPGVAGSYDMVVRCTVCTAELSKTTHEIPALPAKEDTTIVITAAINVTETINTRIMISKEVANYADYDLVISRKKAFSDGGVYNLTEVQDFVYDKGEEVTVMSDGRGAFLYNELGMYELGIDFTVQVKCYDAKGNFVAYATPITTNVGKLAYELYKPTNAAAKNKNIAIDIARLGDEAQKYMVNGKTCGLATVTSPISYFPEGATEGATFDATKLNTINKPTSEVTGVSITPAVNLSGNPCLRYMIQGTGTTYAQDTLRFEIDYTNAKNGSDCGVDVLGADLQVVGTAGTSSVRYANLFSAIALYDGNVTITAKLYSGDTLLATSQYSVESYISANLTNARMGAVLKAVANLGTSARKYFNMDK